jgi:flavin-dependent dehydrogenase
VERDGYCGLATVDDGLTNVALVVPVPLARHARGRAAAFFDAWIAARPQLAARFAGASRVTGVSATGPFAQHAPRAWAPGAMLTGDAADFFDPFTGEGIYAALLGGELLAPFAIEALGAATAARAGGSLAAYDAARRKAFAGKWAVEKLVGLAVGSRMLMDRVVRSLAAAPEMADLFVGVAGDFVPPAAVLSPRFLTRIVFGGPRGAAPAIRPISPAP